MRAVRVLLVLLGLAVVGYGVALVTDNSTEVIIRIVVWALIGVLLHDAVFAPVCLALGFAGRRILPHRTWTPILVAVLLTVVLVLLAIPVYDKPGMHLDNPSVLDRDYRTGFWIALAVVWSSALLYLVGDRVLPVREDDVVEHKGPDDVEAQPPAAGAGGQQGAGGGQPHLER